MQHRLRQAENRPGFTLWFAYVRDSPVQVVSEPGAEEALNEQWEGKLVFARGPESIAEMVEHYTGNEEARVGRQKLSWEYARSTQSLQTYLQDLL